MVDGAEKVRENRVRATLARRGYRVSKSRLRDPLAIGYGKWTVTSASGQAPRTRVVLGSIAEVEQWMESQ